MLAALVLGAVTTSCSKDSKLFDTIPSDVQQVGTIQLKNIMEQAGFVFNGKGVAAPDWAESAEAVRLAEFAGRLDSAGVCDINRLAFAGKDGNIYMTMLVDSKDKFVEITENVVEWSDEKSGYRIGEFNNTGVLVDDSRVWLDLNYKYHKAKATELLGDFVKAAGKESIASHKELIQKLESDNHGNIMVRYSTEAKAKPESGETPLWGAGSFNLKGNKLLWEGSYINADGSAGKVEGMQAVDTDVLAYVPPMCNMIAACGFTDGFDWSVMPAMAKTTGNFQLQGAVASMLPYLEALDGTVMVAAGPVDKQAYDDFNNWKFIGMVHMLPDRIDGLLDMVRSMAAMNGIRIAENADGTMIIPQYGQNIYFGKVDGYLAIANFPFSADHQNEFASVFKGKKSALRIDIPALNLFSPEAPSFGMMISSDFDGGVLKGEVVLTGTEEPFIQAFAKEIK